MRSLHDCRLYGILDTGYCQPENMPSMLRSMIAGGVDIIQLRAKELPEDRILELSRELHPISLKAGIPFIINDFPVLAGRLGAEGTHIGQDDMTVAEAQRLAGLNVFIGKSSHSINQACAAAAEGANYLGFGPLFATQTKPNYPPIGTADIREIHRRVKVPIFCIGGIKLENLAHVIAAGALRAVIVSGILLDEDPESYTKKARHCFC